MHHALWIEVYSLDEAQVKEFPKITRHLDLSYTRHAPDVRLEESLTEAIGHPAQCKAT